MAGDARRLGVYGFGAAAHIVTQIARYQGREVYAFTRRGDAEASVLLGAGRRVGRRFGEPGRPSRSMLRSSSRRSARWFPRP